MGEEFNYVVGKNEIKSKRAIASLTKSMLAEFLGVFILNFFACGACSYSTNEVALSFAFGIAIFVAISIVGHVSGGHLNPAVTVAMLVSAQTSVIRTIFYIIAQCLGAIAGTAALKALLEANHESIGHTMLNEKIEVLQGLGFEFFLGFVLVLTVFGVCDGNKTDSKYTAPLAIGFSVTLGHLGTIRYTGSSMNPARSLGTAVLTGIWTNHWIYWVGPILGGIAASLIYTIFFKASSEIIENMEKYRNNENERDVGELKRFSTRRDF